MKELCAAVFISLVLASCCKGPHCLNSPGLEPLYVVGIETDPPNMKPGESFTQTLPDGNTVQIQARVVGYRIGTRDGKILFVAQPFAELQP